MRLLLDTHVIAWWSEDSPALSPAARAVLLDESNTVYVSPVSAYEISLKHRLGKWPEGAQLLAQLDRLIASSGFEVLLLAMSHASRAGALPPVHRDPFDRLLAAQAFIEELTLVSVDNRLDQFGVRRLW